MPSQEGYVNWIEFIWVCEGCAGILLSIIGIASAFKDRKAVIEGEINHGMSVIARTNIQMEAFRLIPHMFVVSIGLIAWTFKPSPYPFDALTWAVTIMLFCIPLCAAINSLNAIFTRRRLLKINREVDELVRQGS